MTLTMAKKSKSIAGNSTWKVGTIVALKSHLANTGSDFSIVYISGDPAQTSPLMIVTEVIPVKDSADKFQCRCAWFSQNPDVFTEAWIMSDLLKVIEPFKKKDSVPESKIQYGAEVIFRTSNIELAKKKSTLRKQDNVGLNYTITAELTFVSPVMQVLGTIEHKEKDSLEHKKTGETIKEITSCLVKCKYYNPSANKFSETLMPIEALELVRKISDKHLDKIKASITDNVFLLIKISGVKTDSLVKLEKVNFRNGIYYVSVFSYVDNNHFEIAANDFKIVDVKNNFYSEELPRFKESMGKLIVTPIDIENIKKLLTKIDGKKYLRISYKDINENITWRTIDDCKVLTSDELDEKKHKIKVEYLKAHCILRNAIRHFRIDRIQKIQVLDLKK